jgi:hypothetical protein
VAIEHDECALLDGGGLDNLEIAAHGWTFENGFRAGWGL